MSEKLGETFTLSVKCCLHCGLIFVPSELYDSRCPINASHIKLTDIQIVLRKGIESWPGSYKREVINA